MSSSHVRLAALGITPDLSKDVLEKVCENMDNTLAQLSEVTFKLKSQYMGLPVNENIPEVKNVAEAGNSVSLRP